MELREVLALAKQFHAKRIKFGDIEVELFAAVPVPEPIVPVEEDEKPPTEDELLFWSTK